LVDFVIPANDDSVQAVSLILNYLADAVVRGREAAAKKSKDAIDSQVTKKVATEQLQLLIENKHATFVDGPEKGQIGIDTARVYRSGESEGLLGEILKENPTWASKVSIHTKANPALTPFTREGLHKQCNESLKALGVDSVGIYYLHSPDIKTNYTETFTALNELYKEGKFKELGLSNYAAWDVVHIYYMCKNNGWVLPTVYQGVYNAITRSMESELQPVLRTFGLRGYWYNPLGAGFLSGRYNSLDEKITEGRFSPEFDFAAKKDTTNPFAGKGHALYRQRYFKKKFFDSLEVIRHACETEKITMANAAVRWLAHHSALNGKYYDGLLFGASSAKQVEDNLAAYASGPLPESIVSAYSDAWTVAAPESESYFRGYGPKHGSTEWYMARF